MTMTQTTDTTAARPNLLSVEQAKTLDLETVRKLTMAHLNPGQLHFMRLLGFDRVLIERAEGMHYIDTNGRKILDFFGGFGSVGFGHNHPRIIEPRKKFQDQQPQEIHMVFLGSSGSEAMEAALKIAEQAQGPERSTVVYAENSFHGKTKGTLAVTDGALYRSQFKLADNARRMPFGDIEALRKLFAEDRSIGAVVLETIQGGAGIVEAPTAYWKGVRKLCDEFGVLWIADEVQCGMGRSGRFFAFEHHGVIPDITALAKSLGGSKCAMAAMIARRDVFMKAYGQPKKALVHAPATFGGIGEACVTSIEGLNIIYDEGLMENAAAQGNYLIARLNELKAKYPTLIKDVRGRGLMIGVEFADISNTMPFGLRHMVALLDDKLKGSICGFVGALLLAQHNVLVAFTEYNRNVIRLEPPLIVEQAHIDEFITALDDILSRGIAGIVKDYISQVTLSK